ncbi:aminotransferase class I/II-fold pyridoxal phosphate-dependent enzyme [Natrialba swarupiae]|uniref:Aminotransferase class I/II-fold pyridoxal phosphate-dependent enzyme n=1 Tax=Natrialba swarupiae TaxID=2448032 RepID=A0A5D5AP80_9EURY|nr:aminotransferase class I/II-fold pyridoxal phosphate-dependent enzyme [Natrialba swarupiae]TYT62823.1 aminotransferase class I/II-fold pyridoxal phosphate-dependent enzyme [Natrialba swarupiae]
MEDRGFDLEDRLADLGEKRRLSPADRVAERGYFAEPTGGELPVLESAEALVFGSNNYLGLTDDQRVQDAARQAAATVGTGAGASRHVTGDTMVHRDVERLLAEANGCERALAFPSGYAANVGTITALEPDVVFADESNHASLVDGCRLAGCETIVYDHCDVDDLRSKLVERVEQPDGVVTDGGDESWLILTDSVFAADGSVAPLETISDLATEFGAWVMVDEAHATGLYVDGGGIVQAEGLEDQVHVQMGVLSAALASQGGYIAGSDALIEYVLARARPFVHSTGLAPPAAAAASEALHLARHSDARERLWENVSHLRDGLETMGFSVSGESQILPVTLADHEDAHALVRELTEHGIVVPPVVRPPTGPTTADRADAQSVVRLVPMATHDRDDIVACLETLQDASERVGLP